MWELILSLKNLERPKISCQVVLAEFVGTHTKDLDFRKNSCFS